MPNYDPAPVPLDSETDAEFRERYLPHFLRQCNITDTQGFRQKSWDSVMAFLGVDPGPLQEFSVAIPRAE